MAGPIFRRFNPTMAFKTDIMIDFYGQVVDGGGPYIYSGTIVNNTQTEFNALNFSADPRYPSGIPTWNDMVNVQYPAYQILYPTLSVSQEVLIDVYNNWSSKAAHSHAQSDITGLSTDLANRIFSASGMRLYGATGTSDSSSVVTIHLTDTGLSTGAALFTGVPIVVCSGQDFTGTPIASPNASEYQWSNSNKTVSFKISKGTTLLALGNTVVGTGASAVISMMAFGVKA